MTQLAQNTCTHTPAHTLLPLRGHGKAVCLRPRSCGHSSPNPRCLTSITSLVSIHLVQVWFLTILQPMPPNHPLGCIPWKNQQETASFKSTLWGNGLHAPLLRNGQTQHIAWRNLSVANGASYTIISNVTLIFLSIYCGPGLWDTLHALWFHPQNALEGRCPHFICEGMRPKSHIASVCCLVLKLTVSCHTMPPPAC